MDNEHVFVPLQYWGWYLHSCTPSEGDGKWRRAARHRSDLASLLQAQIAISLAFGVRIVQNGPTRCSALAIVIWSPYFHILEAGVEWTCNACLIASWLGLGTERTWQLECGQGESRSRSEA